jgi:hypothetical protein
MNRNANLAKAVPSWLESGAEQIVIVDWHSDEPVLQTLTRELNDLTLLERIDIVRVELPESKRRWVLSWAYNLAVRYAIHPFILKLDADNVLSPNFLNETLNNIDALWCQTYWKGDWRCAKTRQQVYLNGVLLVAKSAFVSVGGYAEIITTYGWDDSAMHSALEKQLGLNAVSLNPDWIQHLPHSDEQRVDKGRNTFREIHLNRFLHGKLGWSLASRPRCQFERRTHVQSRYRDHVELVSWPIVPKEQIEWAERELEKFIALKMMTPPEANRLSTPGKGMLYVLVRNGLGNKMRALASAYTLFDGLNKSPLYNPHGHGYHLIIVWSEDHHCQASMSDLFDLSSIARDYPSQISILKQLPDQLPTPLLELTDLNLFDEYKTADTTVVDNIQSLLQSIQTRAQQEQPINVLLESASVIDSPFRSWENECKFIRAIKLNMTCQERVNRCERHILEQAGLTSMSSMVAVHVRKGQDGSSYDDVSKWSPDKQIQWKMWRSLSRVENFVAEMLNLLDRQPGLKFFVASDSADTFQEMLESFPPNTLFEQEREDDFDRSILQVQSAVVDVALIGKCKVLLGSQWSSFTELCRRWSSIELRLAGIAF